MYENPIPVTMARIEYVALITLTKDGIRPIKVKPIMNRSVFFRDETIETRPNK